MLLINFINIIYAYAVICPFFPRSRTKHTVQVRKLITNSVRFSNFSPKIKIIFGEGGGHFRHLQRK